MMLETETGGVLQNPNEADIRRSFKAGEMVGSFIRLSRSVEDFLYIDLDMGDDERPLDWKKRIKGVYRHDPGFGKSELEDWSPDGYKSETFGGSYRQQLREMLLHYRLGPDAFARWEKSWNGKFRGDCRGSAGASASPDRLRPTGFATPFCGQPSSRLLETVPCGHASQLIQKERQRMGHG